VGFWHADNDSQIQESMSRRVDSAQAAAKRHKGQCQDDVEKTNEKMDLLRRTQPDYDAPLVVPGFTGEFSFSSASSASGEFQQRIARTDPEQLYSPGFVGEWRTGLLATVKVTRSKAAGGAPSNDILASWVSQNHSVIKSEPRQ